MGYRGIGLEHDPFQRQCARKPLQVFGSGVGHRAAKPQTEPVRDQVFGLRTRTVEGVNDATGKVGFADADAHRFDSAARMTEHRKVQPFGKRQLRFEPDDLP